MKCTSFVSKSWRKRWFKRERNICRKSTFGYKRNRSFYSVFIFWQRISLYSCFYNMCTHTHTHIYIYIYIEREREREKYTKRICLYLNIIFYVGSFVYGQVFWVHTYKMQAERCTDTDVWQAEKHEKDIKCRKFYLHMELFIHMYTHLYSEDKNCSHHVQVYNYLFSWLAGIHDMLTLLDYLMPNPVYKYIYIKYPWCINE